MEKTIGYILSQLHDQEVAIKMLRRTLRRQARSNRGIAVLNLSVSIYIFLNEIRWNCQKEINKELQKEIDALKQTKGE